MPNFESAFNTVCELVEVYKLFGLTEEEIQIVEGKE
jgi:hypothetical protein